VFSVSALDNELPGHAVVPTVSQPPIDSRDQPGRDRAGDFANEAGASQATLYERLEIFYQEHEVEGISL
jgi:hypothetical protein